MGPFGSIAAGYTGGGMTEVPRQPGPGDVINRAGKGPMLAPGVGMPGDVINSMGKGPMLAPHSVGMPGGMSPQMSAGMQGFAPQQQMQPQMQPQMQQVSSLGAEAQQALAELDEAIRAYEQWAAQMSQEPAQVMQPDLQPGMPMQPTNNLTPQDRQIPFSNGVVQPTPPMPGRRSPFAAVYGG